MAGRFWVGGKWLGGFRRGENVRGDFGGEISTVSQFRWHFLDFLYYLIDLEILTPDAHEHNN